METPLNCISFDKCFRRLKSPLAALEPVENVFINKMWIQAIRSKILGEANIVLEFYDIDLF